MDHERRDHERKYMIPLRSTTDTPKVSLPPIGQLLDMPLDPSLANYMRPMRDGLGESADGIDPPLHQYRAQHPKSQQSDLYIPLSRDQSSTQSSSTKSPSPSTQPGSPYAEFRSDFRDMHLEPTSSAPHDRSVPPLASPTQTSPDMFGDEGDDDDSASDRASTSPSPTRPQTSTSTTLRRDSPQLHQAITTQPRTTRMKHALAPPSRSAEHATHNKRLRLEKARSMHRLESIALELGITPGEPQSQRNALSSGLRYTHASIAEAAMQGLEVMRDLCGEFVDGEVVRRGLERAIRRYQARGDLERVGVAGRILESLLRGRDG